MHHSRFGGIARNAGKAKNVKPISGLPGRPWAWVYELAGAMNVMPQQLLKLTIPELVLTVRGWFLSKGIDTDEHQTEHEEFDLEALEAQVRAVHYQKSYFEVFPQEET